MPRPLLASALLLAFNSLLLLVWWLLFPGDVASNGAQVFFILLWFGAAWGLLLGEGWIRVGIICLLAAYVWGLLNQPSLAEGLAKVNIADQLSKFIALAAVILLYVPKSHQWFKAEAAAKVE